MSLTSVLLSLILLAPTTTQVLVVNLPPRGTVAFSLGPKGKVEFERIGTVSRVWLRLSEVAPPRSVQSGMNTYVAWAVSPEGAWDNLGELRVSGKDAALEASTKFDRFGLLITVEPHYMVDKPSFAVMFKNDAPREIPTVPVSVELGVYDYANLPLVSAEPKDPALAIQARTALAIAAAAQAEKLAAGEFRQARVSLDTMEELLRRASAADLIVAAAHEAIRRSQHAASVARQTAR